MEIKDKVVIENKDALGVSDLRQSAYFKTVEKKCLKLNFKEIIIKGFIITITAIIIIFSPH